MTNRTVGTLLALLVVLTGCTSDEKKPTVLPPAPSVSPSVSSSVPQALPSDTLAETPQGAAAFTRFYFAEVNRAYLSLNTAGISELATADCGSCAAVARDIERLQREAHTVDGQRYILSAAEATAPGSDGKVVVDFRFTDDPYVEMDSLGRIVQDIPAQGVQDGQALLARVNGKWQITAIRLVGN